MNRQNKTREPEYIGTLAFLGMILLLLLPVFNTIPLCFWAFGKKSGANKRSFARAALILQLPYVAFGVWYIFTLFMGLGGI